MGLRLCSYCDEPIEVKNINYEDWLDWCEGCQLLEGETYEPEYRTGEGEFIINQGESDEYGND